MKFTSLLLLSFLCTCVSAQKSVPASILGSGSMIVEFGEGTWHVSISSATIYEVHKYVSEDSCRESPQTFGGKPGSTLLCLEPVK